MLGALHPMVFQSVFVPCRTRDLSFVLGIASFAILPGKIDDS